MFQSLKELLAWKPPERKDIISNGIFPVGSKLVLAGEEESFKTMLTIDTAFKLCQGLDWYGYNTTPQTVAILHSELPRAEWRNRVRTYALMHQQFPDNFYSVTEYEIYLDKPVGISTLANWLKEIKATVLMIDPLYLVYSGNISDQQDMTHFVTNMNRILWQFKISIWIVHHEGKPLFWEGARLDRGTSALLGSSILKNWANTIISLDANKDKDNVTLSFAKAGLAEQRLADIKLHFNREKLDFGMKEVR